MRSIRFGIIYYPKGSPPSPRHFVKERFSPLTQACSARLPYPLAYTSQAMVDLVQEAQASFVASLPAAAASSSASAAAAVPAVRLGISPALAVVRE